MKRVEQVWIILINKENCEDDLADWSEIKNVYGLMINTLEDNGLVSKEDGVSTYEMSLKSELVGEVIQYHDNSFECDIDGSFQDKYTEDKLEEMIIEDIKEQYFEQFISYNIDDWIDVDIEPDEKKAICVKDVNGNIYHNHYWSGNRYYEFNKWDNGTIYGYPSDVDIISWKYYK